MYTQRQNISTAQQGQNGFGRTTTVDKNDFGRDSAVGPDYVWLKMLRKSLEDHCSGQIMQLHWKSNNLSVQWRFCTTSTINECKRRLKPFLKPRPFYQQAVGSIARPTKWPKWN
ncbi:hypothetical protein L3X38_014004 [Prunus dulcis]|uniref:Uncharacterized protein n=1 Tax=Prunus dulcis TaxID=3755 RepID=A0AAD4WME3_PRUDU|nr:hypothetical protein L3X38_014004 [Prunus dulcis]